MGRPWMIRVITLKASTYRIKPIILTIRYMSNTKFNKRWKRRWASALVLVITWTSFLSLQKRNLISSGLNITDNRMLVRIRIEIKVYSNIFHIHLPQGISWRRRRLSILMLRLMGDHQIITESKKLCRWKSDKHIRWSRNLILK